MIRITKHNDNDDENVLTMKTDYIENRKLMIMMPTMIIMFSTMMIIMITVMMITMTTLMTMTAKMAIVMTMMTTHDVDGNVDKEDYNDFNGNYDKE